jgi:hypothetical protein
MGSGTPAAVTHVTGCTSLTQLTSTYTRLHDPAMKLQAHCWGYAGCPDASCMISLGVWVIFGKLFIGNRGFRVRDADI